MSSKNKIPAIRFKGFCEDWETKFNKDVCSISTGKSNTQDKVEDGLFPFFVRSSIVERSNKFLFDEEAVLTAGDGVGTGKVFHYINGKYDLHQRVYKMYNFNGVIGQYFYYYFAKHFYDRVMAMTAKSSVDSVRLEMISEMEIDMPHSTSEQNKIASFLSVIDHLITQSTKILEKLKNLKKAYLEKMFPRGGATTPELRFKGFSDEWSCKALGMIGNPFTGLSGKTKVDFGHGEAVYITYMNVFSNPISNIKEVDKIEIDNNQNKVIFGDVLFTTSSETPEEVGMSSVWLGNEGNVYLNSFCFGYRPEIDIDPYYFAYLLRSSVVRQKISFLAQGISRYNISKNRVMEIEIAIPKLNEQMQIGNFFRNIDEQIAKQTEKLEKLKNIKKACLDKMFV